MIHVIAEIEVRDGAREMFLEHFRRVVPIVRDEIGCIEYGPAIDLSADLAQQPELRSNIVTIIEKWSSVPELKAHLTAPHMEEYRKKAKDLVVGLTIRVLKPA